jgi:hypothetical protein
MDDDDDGDNEDSDKDDITPRGHRLLGTCRLRVTG